MTRVSSRFVFAKSERQQAIGFYKKKGPGKGPGAGRGGRPGKEVECPKGREKTLERERSKLAATNLLTS